MEASRKRRVLRRPEGGERAWAGEGPDLLFAEVDHAGTAHALPQQRRSHVHRRHGAGRSGAADGRGLGVVAADLNDDGRIDLYVANDMCPNFVFLNRGDGTFDDVTQSSGAGYGPQGQTRAGMGVDAEDVDGDGRTDIFVTNFWAEGNALFINLGEGLFEDRSRTAGLYHDTISWVAWGCSLADFDSDGWPDCFATTGHIDDNLRLMSRYFHQYAQPPLLHRNQRGKGFTLATRAAGAYFDSDHVGRGVAQGDLDNDGDVDLVINHKDAAPALLRNDTPTKNHWIRLRLEGTRSNRDAIGARVEIRSGGRTIVRQRKGGASYGSSHDPRLTIGLGDATTAGEVTIRWPSGQVDCFKDLAADTGWLLREGVATGAHAAAEMNASSAAQQPRGNFESTAPGSVTALADHVAWCFLLVANPIPGRKHVNGGLTDAKVRARHLVAGFQIEGYGEVGGDPQREGREWLAQGERRRPNLELLRRFFTPHGSTGNCRQACQRQGCHADIDGAVAIHEGDGVIALGLS